MNGTHEQEGHAGTALAAVGWLISIRLMFILAWIFNVVILTVLFWSAWQNDQAEKLVCMGFLLAWLVGPTGWIAFRSVRKRPVMTMRS